MTDKILAYLSLSTFVLFLLLWLVTGMGGWQLPSHLLNLCYAAFTLSGLWLVVKNGTLTQNFSFMRVLSFLTGLIILGSLFKMNKWPYGEILFGIGVVGIPAVYAFRFLSKGEKGLLDMVKLIWVISAFALTFTKVLHFPYSSIFAICSTISFLAMLSIFLYKNKGLYFG